VIDIQLKKGEASKARGEICLIACFEDVLDQGALAAVDEKMGGRIQRTAAAEGFTGGFLSSLLIRSEGAVGFERLLLVGLGKPSEMGLDRLRKAMGRGATAVQALGIETLSIFCDLGLLGGASASEWAQTVAEGVVLSLYRFDRFKSKPPEQKPVRECVLIVPDEKQLADMEAYALRGRVIAEGSCLVRDLCNTPSNIVTPTYLAQEARKLEAQAGVRVKILERADMARLGMGAFLAVAQGTAEAPKFIVIEYKGGAKKARGRPIALVGKSVTFDSGGISLKPSDKMEQMKYDMSGGATVLGVMQAITRLKLPIHVVALLPATDNMPSGTAVHPGDVVTTLSGKTVEVINTDAEGRLLLADALAYAVQTYKPKAMIDLATLTGACVVALGQHAIGIMGNDRRLISRVAAAGEAVGERTWELPLWEDYFKQIESDVADLKNVGGRGAGTITAGLFLKQFVGETPWVHFDIAGTSWFHDGAHPYIPKGSTGIGMRLLVHFLITLAERKKR